jgi:DivIVA domain-containing protein
VALDRQSIARRDFPTHGRGYDPAAVDAHLQAVADEVAALERRAGAAAPLSAQAGAQVQAIIEAAERGAQAIRAAAERESKERLAHAAEAADRLRARIERLEEDITELMAGLRDGARRLHDELAATQAQAEGLAPAPAEPAPEPEPAPTSQPEAVPEPTATAGAEPAGDAEAARIVALDMALSGTPREETERYLAEHYELGDRDALLDEVYAAAGA